MCCLNFNEVSNFVTLRHRERTRLNTPSVERESGLNSRAVTVPSDPAIVDTVFSGCMLRRETGIPAGLLRVGDLRIVVACKTHERVERSSV